MQIPILIERGPYLGVLCTCCSLCQFLLSQSDGGERGTLFWVLNHTRTPFGRRKLRNWVSYPLTNIRWAGLVMHLISSPLPIGGKRPWNGAVWSSLHHLATAVAILCSAIAATVKLSLYELHSEDGLLIVPERSQSARNP